MGVEMKNHHKVPVTDDELVVSKNDFGILVRNFVKDALHYLRYEEKWTIEKIRSWWPKLEDYYKRHIQTDIEVAIMMDDPSHRPEPLHAKEMWVQFLKDVRPAKSPFTVKYHCHKCKQKNVKLWRGVHGCSDENGHELLCATCLAPGAEVDDKGKWQEPEPHGMRTDQVKGWLPAVPTDDTYWGYSSVPSQDVEWWIALPTYP